jgi:exonuclease SbcC
MSYKTMDEALSFSSIHTAVLCGPNGHGKSSILDAITWALWGRARGVDKRGTGTDDLIHNKEQNMQVEFSFELEGQQYRVVRSRARKGKSGVSRLEFQILDNGDPRSITGETIGATQEAINRALRIDYETFVNSAFIMQGRADTFMTQSANERKAILAEILGLSVYDELEEKARAKRRENNESLKLIDDRISYIDKETEVLPALELDLKKAVDELSSIQNVIRDLELKSAKLNEQKTAYDMKMAQLSECNSRCARAKSESEALDKQLFELNEGMNKAKALVNKTDEINKGYEELVSLRAKEEQLTLAGQEFGKLEAKANASKLIIAKAKSEMEANSENLKKRIGTLESQLSQKSVLASELSANKSKLGELENIERQLTEMREKYATCQQEKAAMEAKKQATEAKITDIEKRRDLLTDGDSCPLCKKHLEKNEIAALHSDVELELKQAKSELEKLTVEINNSASELDKLKKEGLLLSEKLKGKNELQIKEGTLNEKLKALDEAAKELETVKLQFSETQRKLSEQNFAKEQQSELAKIEAQIKLIAYSPSDHQTVREQIKKAAQFEQLKASLDGARSSIVATETAVVSLNKHKQSLIESIAEDEKTASRITLEISAIGDIAGELKKMENEFATARKSEAEAIDRRSAIQTKIENLLGLKKQKDELLEERTGAANNAAVYDTLAFAFSKKGIQALIIENTVPEIEEEANSLLKRLTNNQMSLRFITQKDQKTGGVIETLDLVISDGDLGDRKYELFSGGEAFRINFAVRIALSKLLARRAGARLETLVIDEGFGTQDEDGKERIIDAISAIQNDFKKIIVITHLDDLKELFPARIEVTKKRGQGSVVQIV